MSLMTLVKCSIIFILTDPIMSIKLVYGNLENSNEGILESSSGRVKRVVRAKRASGTPDTFTEDEQISGLDLHNKYRSEEGASNMEYMEWHPELARMAQDYTEGCLYEHSNMVNNGCYNVTYDRVGENLHFSTGKVPLTTAVTAWFVEKTDYNFTTVTCAENKVCGHYTQVVWAKSKLIGCGRAFCAELRENNANTVKDAYFTSCNYGKKGNYAGTRPYVKGDPCSSCPDDQKTCKDQMCYQPGVDYQRPADKLIDCKTTTIADGDQITTTVDTGKGKAEDKNNGDGTATGESTTDNGDQITTTVDKGKGKANDKNNGGETATGKSTTGNGDDDDDDEDDGDAASYATVFPGYFLLTLLLIVLFI